MRINDAGLEEALEELRGLSTTVRTQRDDFEVALAMICLGLEVPLGKVLELDSEEKFLLVRAAIGWRHGIVEHASVPATTASNPERVLPAARACY